eukprot:TRINITY_DN15693_c0_g1_i3.p1 TRINITY_DN15693_c0_g1~~TRINITY_DN15693_c0_g1_i3.p1  ORF type:complete len:819 (-),score=115.68 TRINITY_DN15693_c0_g1_i3:53-2425(-)
MKLAQSTGGVNIGLVPGWVQRDLYSSGHYCLRVLDCLARSIPITEPTRTSAAALLEGVDSPEAEALTVKLRRPRLMDTRFLVDEELDTNTASVALQTFRTSRGLNVHFSIVDTTQPRTFGLLLPSLMAQYPLRLVFDTAKAHFLLLMAANKKYVPEGSMVNGLLRIQQRQAQLAIQEKQQRKIHAAASCVVRLPDGRWRCTTCAPFLVQLEGEFSEQPHLLRYARGEASMSATTVGRQQSNIRRHMGGAAHKRAVQLSTPGSENTNVTATDIPKQTLCAKVKVTSEQYTSLVNLVYNVATATQRAEGLSSVGARLQDDKRKGLHVLDTHYSRKVAKEFQTILWEVLLRGVVGAVRACRAATLKVDGTTFARIDLMIVIVSGISRTDCAMKDWCVGTVDLKKADAESQKDELVKLFDSLQLSQWARRSLKGFAADGASTMKSLRGKLEIAWGCTLIDVHDAAHMHQLSVGLIKKTRKVVEHSRLLRHWFAFFRSTARQKSLQIISGGKCLSFPKEHSVRWAAATFRRLNAAVVNFDFTVAMLGEIQPPPFFYHKLTPEYSLSTCILADVFDINKGVSEALQKRDLSLSSMESILQNALTVHKVLARQPGKHEAKFYENQGTTSLPPGVVAEMTSWRSKLCHTIYKDLAKRWEECPCRSFSSFFATSGKDSTCECLMALASRLGYDQAEILSIGMEWVKLRLECTDLRGNLLKEFVVDFLLESESSTFAIVLEAMVALSPSTVFVEAAFSVVTRMRGSFRKALSAASISQELGITLVLSPDDAERNQRKNPA